jgi:hypothetical protein
MHERQLSIGQMPEQHARRPRAYTRLGQERLIQLPFAEQENATIKVLQPTPIAEDQLVIGEPHQFVHIIARVQVRDAAILSLR